MAPEIIFGPDARKQLSNCANQFEVQRAFLVSDENVAAAGWLDEISDSLAEAGIEVVTFTEISSNPRSSEVESAAEAYAESGCELIIALGGGSVIDAAKGIGLLSTNGGTIEDYTGINAIRLALPPLIALPTTAGSSADVSQFAIISNETSRTKMALINRRLVPEISLVDPAFLSTLPPYLAACTGIDALCHGIEAYVSNASSALSDVHAIEAVRLVRKSIVATVHDSAARESRAQTMLGSLHAGLAFSNAGLGAVHAMAHSLGGLKDLPHGECNALLLPHVIRFNFHTCAARYRHLALALGVDTYTMEEEEACVALVQGVSRLCESCGIEGSLLDRGVSYNDIDTLAEHAMADACRLTNPRPVTLDDFKSLFKDAL